MVVTPQAFSHRAIACKSSVNVSNSRTGRSSRSGGTATKISRAPISMPPALGSRHGRSATHIPFRFFRRPNWAWVFGLRVFPCFLLLDTYSAPLAPGSGQIAQTKGTLWVALSQFYASQGKIAQAEVEIRKAIGVDPHAVPPRGSGANAWVAVDDEEMMV